jgi:hypothetical protein
MPTAIATTMPAPVILAHAGTSQRKCTG